MLIAYLNVKSIDTTIMRPTDYNTRYRISGWHTLHHIFCLHFPPFLSRKYIEDINIVVIRTCTGEKNQTRYAYVHF